jgi:hypothetical protein
MNTPYINMSWGLDAVDIRVKGVASKDKYKTSFKTEASRQLTVKPAQFCGVESSLTHNQ